MAVKTLSVDLSEGLYFRFIEIVTQEDGPWRSKRRGETSTDAIESAVTAALMLFIQNIDGQAELLDFRDYIQEKYPGLDEDLFTMIEDLIERKRQQVA